MDNNSSIPSFEIPKSAEQLAPHAAHPDRDPGMTFDGTHEILPPPVPSSQGQQPMTPVVDPVQANTPLTGAAPSAPAANVGVVDDHLIAEDSDVMEKEWVDRAKKIIAMTSDDPYLEAQEIGKLKATYMKKRFNKDLPVAEGN